MPNIAHLKLVGRFMLTNSWFLLVVYLVSLLLNDWRWEIFTLFILVSYLYPLLTGKDSFLQKVQAPRSFEQSESQVRQSEPMSQPENNGRTQQSQLRRSGKNSRLHLMNNPELRIGTWMLLPSLICYIVARQVIKAHDVQINQILNQTGLGVTVYVYCIGLGILGIAAAMIVGGLVKSVTHHWVGGQRFKRWGIVTAGFTILLAVVMYQNAAVMTSAGQIVSTIGAFIMPFLPWLAVILYGLGIVKNVLTPQNNAK
ncbi:hypothetical protein L3V66_08100 [Secundilactobacillus sp. HBUAS58055]|nr:hypothetical protein [Secundilactobacillus angelensis]MCH5462734.1 hypothetical protein [Secundilactobacillus angelensis]